MMSTRPASDAAACLDNSSDALPRIRNGADCPPCPARTVRKVRGRSLSLMLPMGEAIHADDYTWPKKLTQARNLFPRLMGQAFSPTITTARAPIRMLKVRFVGGIRWRVWRRLFLRAQANHRRRPHRIPLNPGSAACDVAGQFPDESGLVRNRLRIHQVQAWLGKV